MRESVLVGIRLITLLTQGTFPLEIRIHFFSLKNPCNHLLCLKMGYPSILKLAELQ